ncbi:MAG TPA: hypothetical protein PKY77_02665 [Phycisphaerae bacterium]|nr:hypothetical protein [Phycisphaerae bacterium]HRY66647.1 hypothetical protein [Phycisphaerae bacterium]HSA27650.1 hypothetical protein [Phycisphaerae bacterium]
MLTIIAVYCLIGCVTLFALPRADRTIPRVRKWHITLRLPNGPEKVGYVSVSNGQRSGPFQVIPRFLHRLLLVLSDKMESDTARRIDPVLRGLMGDARIASELTARFSPVGKKPRGPQEEAIARYASLLKAILSAASPPGRGTDILVGSSRRGRQLLASVEVIDDTAVTPAIERRPDTVAGGEALATIPGLRDS